MRFIWSILIYLYYSEKKSKKNEAFLFASNRCTEAGDFTLRQIPKLSSFWLVVLLVGNTF